MNTANSTAPRTKNAPSGPTTSRASSSNGISSRSIWIAASSELFADPFVATGELVRVLPEWEMPEDSGWAVFPGRRLMPAKLRVFLDMMEEAFCTGRGGRGEAA